jgi:hypothetical protein
MRKIILLVVLFLLSYLLIIPVHASTWVQVTTFTGATTMNTDYFIVNCTEWRLNWSYMPSVGIEQYAGFYVSAHEKNGDMPIYIYQSGNTTLSGVSYAHNANGTFYLSINVANLASYTIIIEEDFDTVIPEYSNIILIAILALTVVVAIVCKKQTLST